MQNNFYLIDHFSSSNQNLIFRLRHKVHPQSGPFCVPSDHKNQLICEFESHLVPHRIHPLIQTVRGSFFVIK